MKVETIFEAPSEFVLRMTPQEAVMLLVAVGKAVPQDVKTTLLTQDVAYGWVPKHLKDGNPEIVYSLYNILLGELKKVL